MTKRRCPYCGGENLHIDNVSGDSLYWKDSECGYAEITTHREKYDRELRKIVPQEMKVKSVHKPRAPLPVYQQPEYLRSGKIPDIMIEPGQMTFGELSK